MNIEVLELANTILQSGFILIAFVLEVYKDLKQNKDVINANRLKKRKLFKNLTSIFLILIVIALNFCVVVKYFELTPLFCVIHGVATLYVVLYSCNLIGRYKQLTYQFLTKRVAFNFKMRLVVRLFAMLIFVCVLLCLNKFLIKTSIFDLDNFANLYANLILFAMLFVDYLLAFVFYRNMQSKD